MTMPTVSDPDLEILAARLEAVREAIRRVIREAGAGKPQSAEAAIERHRPEVYAAMEALGMAAYDFTLSRPSPERLAAAQTMVSDGLRTDSMTSPIAQYSSPASRPNLSYFEVVQHVRERSAAGADLPARIIDDYYIHTRIGEAFLNRLHLFNRRLIDEVALCHAGGLRPFHLVGLQYVGGAELLALARSPAMPDEMRITCLDLSATAVRHAQQTLRPVFKTRIELIMADPARWLNGATAPSGSACIIYATSYLEQLTPKRVVQLLEGAHRVLRPGGVLLAGATAGDVPTAEHMIRDWLLGWHWKYRTESEWRELFAKTPFGADGITFEYEPLGINALMRARKSN
jgi:SAM-dependent methyltransferase